MDPTIVTSAIAAVATIVAAAVGAYAGREKGRKEGAENRVEQQPQSEWLDQSLTRTIRRHDDAQAARTSQLVQARMTELEYAPDVCSVFATCFHELAENAFQFGCTSDDQSITVVVAVNEITATMAIANAFGVAGPAELPEHWDPHRAGGRGLRVCAELADWFEFANMDGRGSIMVGLFKDRLRFSREPLQDDVTVLVVMGNLHNKTLVRRMATHLNDLLVHGQHVIIEFQLATKQGRPLGDHDLRGEVQNPTTHTIGFVMNQYVAKDENVIMIADLGLASLFPDYGYAANRESALEKFRARKRWKDRVILLLVDTEAQDRYLVDYADRTLSFCVESWGANCIMMTASDLGGYFDHPETFHISREIDGIVAGPYIGRVSGIDTIAWIRGLIGKQIPACMIATSHLDWLAEIRARGAQVNVGVIPRGFPTALRYGLQSVLNF